MQRPLYQQQDPELRRLKESFVSNLHGTTRWEVFCVLSSLPLCLLVAAYVEARIAARVRSSSMLSKKQHWQLPKFAFEFFGGAVPLLLLLMSVAPAEPAFLLLFLLWGSLALKLWMRLAHGPGARQHMAHMLQHMAAPRKRFVSAFRGGVMAATCLAILGVDFPVFPRRYAKAEGYGGGVMDVGVGAIVFAGGLVSAVAAGAAAGDGAAAAGSNASAAAGSAMSAGKGAGSSSNWGRRLGQLLRGVRAAVPLMLLGGARELATVLVGYQVHLGEYGLNWNFFYTIAAVTLLTLAVPVPPQWLGPLGLGISTAHQVLLNSDLFKALAGIGTPGGSSSSSSAGQLLLGLLPQLLQDGCGTSAAAAGAAVGDIGLAPSTISSSGSSSAATTPTAAAAAGGCVTSFGAWLHMELGVEARQAAGFWASNKEGLGSLPGYWALHLLGAAVGHQLGLSCAATAARARAQLSARAGGSGGAGVGEAGRLVWAWVGVWWVVDLGLWGVLATLEAAVEPVSRRACNLPYVLWTTAQCLAWLLLVVMADLLTSVLCSSSGGCATSSGSSTLVAPATAAAAGHGSNRRPVRRSLEASAAHTHHSNAHSLDASTNSAAAAAAGGGQQLPVPQSAGGSLQRRSIGGKKSGGSPQMAAAAAAAALTAAGAAAAVGSGSIAGGSVTAVAAAAAAVVDSQQLQQGSGSRDGSPRKPSGSKSAGHAGGAQGSPRGGGSDKGSPKGGGSDHSSNVSSSSSPPGGGGGSAASTPARNRRPGSRLQPPQQQQQQQQQREEPSPGTSSSGGPMRLMLAFNRNMLALFLVANLLTGCVNLSINTLAVGSWAARVIVGVYMLLLCGLAVLLDKKGIVLKL